MKILRYDQADLDALDVTDPTGALRESYLYEESNYSVVPFKSKQKPTNAWAMPYVTGHRYRVHWAEGLDFTRMKVEISDLWEEADQNILINMNFTDVREAVNFTDSYGSGTQHENLTLFNEPDPLNWQSGDNNVWNDTATREFEFAINGRNASRNNILIEGERCIGGCLEEVIE